MQLIKREHHLRPKLFRANDSSTNGEYWLDSEYPYMRLTASAANTWGRRGRVFWISFDDTPETAGLLHRTSVTVDDHFQSYLLYEPPDGGFGMQPVPLHRVDWNFTGRGIRDPVGLFGHSPWRFELPGGRVRIKFSQWYNGHPRWKHRYTNPGE